MARLSVSPGGGGGYGGTGWTNNRYEQVKHFQGWQFIAIDSIAKKIACQRPGVYRVHQFAEPKKRQKCLAGPYKRKAMADLKPHEDLEPLPPEYPLCQLFQNPNPPDTSYDLWYETILYLLLTGNSYWWLPKNGLGKPAEIWCLPAHWVWPIFDQDCDLVAYELRPLLGSVGTCRLDADDVVHFKFKNPLSKIDGYSPLAAIANWIDVAESIDKARYHAFDNGGNPGMIALLDDETVDPTDAEVEQFETKLAHKFRGVTKTGRITALSGVKDLKPYTTTPAEMAYVESDDQARDKVLAGFRVSKVLAGISTEVNRASHEGAVLSFCENTINPLLFQLGATITEKVATRFDPRLRVSWMDCTPDDPAQKLAEQTADVAAGATTPNEIRQERGKEPYAYGGDDPLVSTTLAPMPMNSPPEADVFDWASIVKPGDAKKDEAEGEEENSEDDGKPTADGDREEADGEEEEDDGKPAFSANGYHGGRF